MSREESPNREIQEATRQLRAVEVEVQRLAKEFTFLDEQVRAADQKNYEEQTRLGKDPVDILPSKELKEALSRRDQNLRSIEKLNQKKRDVEARLHTLQTVHLEAALIDVAGKVNLLKRREEELQAEIETVREEIQKLEIRKEELAVELARQSAPASNE